MATTGKLELLFAHMTVNNIHYIKPLIYEAIEEYDTLSRKLSAEEQRKLVTLKDFLYHAEHDKWQLARHQLTSAEEAYRNYMQQNIKHEAHDYQQHDTGSRMHTATTQMSSATPMSSATRISSATPFSSSQSSQQLESRNNSLRAITATSEGSRPSSRYSIHRDGHNISKTGTHATERLSSNTPDSVVSYSSSLKRFSRSQKSDSTFSKPSKQVSIKSCDELEDGDPGLKESKSKEDAKVPLTETQIADLFRCIYDREWKYALTALVRLGVGRKDGISCLLHIVEECYWMCEMEAKKQIVETEPEVEITEKLIETFQINALSKWLRHFGIETSSVGEIDAYVRQCIEVTWKIRVQTPPIHLITEKQRDDKTFNPNHYKCFTKYGQVLDFYVWPALLYHAGGPILAKGVAQSR